MFHVVLFQPEIPPNTGNIIRLCANTGCQLHLIEPLGFGLDYHEYATVNRHKNIDECLTKIGSARIMAFTTKANKSYVETKYQKGDVFIFGPESRGLPPEILGRLPAENLLRLPMRPGCRSLNLSNTVAVTVYEAWRQLDFALD